MCHEEEEGWAKPSKLAHAGSGCILASLRFPAVLDLG